MSESNFISWGVGFDGLTNSGAYLFTVDNRGWAIIRKGIIEERVLNLRVVIIEGMVYASIYNVPYALLCNKG